MERDKQLSNLNSQIAERKKYLRAQEAIIEDTVESGNTKLMGLKYEITAAEQELKDLKTDIRLARQDKQLLDEDIQTKQRELFDDNSFMPLTA